MLTLKFTVYILVVLLCYNHHNFSTISPFGYFHRFENIKLFFDQKGFQRFPPKFQIKSVIRKKEINIGKKTYKRVVSIGLIALAAFFFKLEHTRYKLQILTLQIFDLRLKQSIVVFEDSFLCGGLVLESHDIPQIVTHTFLIFCQLCDKAHQIFPSIPRKLLIAVT